MATGVITWSQTAATNASSDSAVNWAEGMAPSAVNDSARALMSSVAKWRDDLNGTITTTGTSTAYAVTSNQGEAALTAGYVVAFVPHATNGATVTLNVDALGAKPLRSAPGVDLPAGVVVQGTPYAATYYTSNSGEWILHGFYGNPYSIPIGGMMPYVGSTAPNSSFVLPYGQAISRTTYATLFSLCSTSFGTGDGSTTFNVPDLRGRTPFGQDNMGGVAASRITTAVAGVDGTTVGANGGAQSMTIAQANLPATTVSVTVPQTIIKNSTGTSTLKAVISGSPVSTEQAGSNDNVYTIAQFTDAYFPGATGTTANLGSGTALGYLPPALIVPWIIRVI